MNEITLDMPFSDCEYYPCDLVALDSFLEFSGYATAAVIHREWHFQFARLNGRYHISFNRTSLEERLFASGIHITRNYHPDIDSAWDQVSKVLKTGQPVAILADTKILERHYYPGRGHHSGHYIILAGVRDHGRSVFVVDPSWIVRFRGEIPLSSLKSAWRSPEIGGCRWITAAFESLPEKVDLETFHRSAVENCKHMGARGSEQGGIVGLGSLLAEIESLGELDQQSRSVYLKGLHSLTRAGVTERDGHGRYLGIVAAETADPELLRLSEKFEDTRKEWMIFRNLCLRGQKRPARNIVSRLSDRMKNILNLECNALVDLVEFLDQV